jgi:hypothetical protein
MAGKISDINNALAAVVGDELLEVTATPSGTPTTKTVTPTVLTAAATAHAASDGTSHANVVLNDTHRNDAVGTDHSALVTVASTGAMHVTADGSSHGFINQSVTTTATPTFAQLTLTTSTAALLTDTGAGAQTLINTDASSNLFFGIGAGNATHSGATDNTAFGTNALMSLTSGDGNWCVGTDAGTALTTGSRNVLIGASAGKALTTGNDQVCIGEDAGSSMVNPTLGNVYIGFGSGLSNVTSRENVGVGRSTLRDGLGDGAGAGQNMAIGSFALANCTTGKRNTCIGRSAGDNTTTADNFVAIGYEAGRGAIGASGDQNTWVGQLAGNSFSTGHSNVAIGAQAGQLVTSGLRNTLLGFKAGDSITTGDYNIIIGAVVDHVATSSIDNQLNIGNIIYSDDLRLGGANPINTVYATGNLGITEQVPAAKLHVHNRVTTSAEPVLTLEQDDVSEPFIDFVGTSSTGAANSLSTGTTAGAAAGWIQIDINGAKQWLQYFADPSA